MAGKCQWFTRQKKYCHYSYKILKYFIDYGHNEFILCLGHKKDQIIKYFEASPLSNATVHLIDTGDGSTSKSDRLLKIEHLIKADTFFCAYGDDLSNVNLYSHAKLLILPFSFFIFEFFIKVFE